MGDEQPRNAVVDAIRRTHAEMNAGSGPWAGMKESLSPDFRSFDSRSGGMNFGELTADEWAQTLEDYWTFGDGRPHFEILQVIAVRGERCAATLQRIDFGGDVIVEFIVVMQIGDDNLLRRYHAFNPDDVDSAVMELDRLARASGQALD